MKKSILILLISIICLGSAKAQDSAFTLKGKLEKIKTGTIHLSIYEGSKTLKDSTTIKDGNFQFSGFVTSPFFCHFNDA